MKYLLSAAVVVLILLTGFKNHQVKNLCPKLKVSANHRFLIADGQPFFWLGDTGWLLLSKLNSEDAEKYLEERKVQGFNVIQVMVLHELSAVNAYGDSALIGKNITLPRLGTHNVAGQPQRKGYWENLDEIIDRAARKGLYMALVPVWGSNVKGRLVNSKQAEIYAEFLAKRYKEKSNIIWLNGGDVRGDDSAYVWKTIGKTLKKYDPYHLVTFHPFGRTQSSTWFNTESWLDFNMFQSGHRRYDQDTARNENRFGEDNWRYVQSDLNKIPLKPTLDGEPSYEGMPQGLHDTLQPRWSSNDLRRYAYWSLFSGGCGFTYGNNSVMQFYMPGSKTRSYGANVTWMQALNDPGARQMVHLKNLLLKFHFGNLIPCQDLIINQGERYQYVVALKGEKVLLVYTYTGRTIKLKLRQTDGSRLHYCWFNPRTGEMGGKENVMKMGQEEFDPPGNEENGNDWVLILENGNS